MTEQLEIQPTFPATFRLDVCGRPPVAFPPVVDLPPPQVDSRVTFGHFVAARSNANLTEYMPFPTNHRDPGILGVDPRYMIYYMPDGAPEGSPGSLILHGTFSPGFHMMDVTCIGPRRQRRSGPASRSTRPPASPSRTCRRRRSRSPTSTITTVRCDLDSTRGPTRRGTWITTTIVDGYPQAVIVIAV